MVAGFKSQVSGSRTEREIFISMHLIIGRFRQSAIWPYCLLFVMVLHFSGRTRNVKIAMRDGPAIPVSLSYRFFTPEAENGVVLRRTHGGEIFAVRTPTDGIGYLTKLWKHDQFEAAVQKKSEALQENENGIYLSHRGKGPYFEHFSAIPTIKAWNTLKPYIRDGDEIWTFADLDSGFVVLRNGYLYCLILTGHSL